MSLCSSGPQSGRRNGIACNGDGGFDVKIASAFLAVTGLFGVLAAPALAQAPPSASSVKNVSRTTKAVNYRRAGGATMINFQGTELMQLASGEAKVQNKGSRTDIEAKFAGLDEATKFGLEYLTYVLWAVSPGGRAVNLGEVVLKSGAGQVKAITDMQTFGMIVTAEPYFAVTQPGNTVVLENVFGPATLGKVENIDASYELLGRGIYSSSNTRIENAIFGIDRKTPLELFEARNSLRIAHIALADKYAAPALAKAEQQLRSAEENANAKIAADKKAAEDREAKARADALAEIQRRKDAELARQQAEAAKADALRMQQEAQQAAAAAARQQAEAEKASAAALLQQQAAQAAADQAAKDRAAAEAETLKARQATAQAEAEKTPASLPAAQSIEFHFADSRLRSRPHRQHVRCPLRHRQLHSQARRSRKTRQNFRYRPRASRPHSPDRRPHRQRRR